MFNRIEVLSIPVKDQQVAKSFYTNVLGGKVVEDMPFSPEGDTRWIRLELPGVETTLTLVTWFPQMPPGCLQGIVLTTNDIASAHAQLKKRGLAISDIEKQPYGLEATFTDPDGNGWVLQERSAVS
ncbi:MAG: VOC family protein [Chloroflexi bacterium]|nr:VOC family protein [Chloroflexota bacterium]MCI0577688.1 VOC family protein [Chloroflexota bacterium]MCI0644592.1 VOC family protein [Chloroflexota bacterium]MCI0728242.1 VOC family protein [Chloroflexota bacterium]